MVCLSATEIKSIECLSKIPGITVDEIRKAARLDKHPDPEIGGLALNLPLSAEAA